MKKNIQILLLCLLFAGCKSGKMTNENADFSAGTEMELKNYPVATDDMERYVIFPEPKGDKIQESNYQIEIIPGKMMEVDCNQHSLIGTLVEKTVKGFQYPYYEFKSNGQGISTLMGCPDNILTTKFIKGETKLIRYNSNLPIVVFAPKGFSVKYRIWEGKGIQNMEKGFELDGDKNIAHFPKIENREQYAFIPKSETKEIDRQLKIEIIPGKMMEVDCNKHRLMGTIKEKMLKGFQFPYYEFASNGNASSTMMACPDGKKEIKFVAGETQVVRYNSRLPVVVYAPQGFEVKYRIWEAKEVVTVEGE